MFLYSICTIPIPIDIDMYLRNATEYTQVHVQFPYISMSPYLYVPLTE